MSDKQVVVQQGSGPCFLLFLVFLILKLCAVIDWSWVWVCAPLWIPFAIVIGFIASAFLIAALLAIFGFFCIFVAGCFKSIGKCYRKSQK